MPVEKPASFWGFVFRDQEQDLELLLSLGTLSKDKVGSISLFWFSGKCCLRILFCFLHPGIRHLGLESVRGSEGWHGTYGLKWYENWGCWLNMVGALLSLKASFITGTITVRSRLYKLWQYHRRRQVTIKQCGDIHFRSK